MMLASLIGIQQLMARVLSRRFLTRRLTYLYTNAPSFSALSGKGGGFFFSLMVALLLLILLGHVGGLILLCLVLSLCHSILLLMHVVLLH